MDGLEVRKRFDESLDVGRSPFGNHVEVERRERRSVNDGADAADDDEIDLVLHEDAEKCLDVSDGWRHRASRRGSARSIPALGVSRRG
jgi:hypothetical protein